MSSSTMLEDALDRGPELDHFHDDAAEGIADVTFPEEPDYDFDAAVFHINEPGSRPGSVTDAGSTFLAWPSEPNHEFDATAQVQTGPPTSTQFSHTGTADDTRQDLWRAWVTTSAASNQGSWPRGGNNEDVNSTGRQRQHHWSASDAHPFHILCSGPVTRDYSGRWLCGNCQDYIGDEEVAGVVAVDSNNHSLPVDPYWTCDSGGPLRQSDTHAEADEANEAGGMRGKAGKAGKTGRTTASVD